MSKREERRAAIPALAQKFLDLEQQGMTQPQIAAQCGVSRQWVSRILLMVRPRLRERGVVYSSELGRARAMDFLELEKRGVSHAQIAAKWGISVRQVSRILLRVRPKRRDKAVDCRSVPARTRALEFLELEQLGLTQPQIADTCNVHQTSVSQALLTVRPRRPRVRPGRNETEIEALKQLWPTGASYREMSKETGIPFGSIASIAKRIDLPPRHSS
jgi:hypothetical protein